MEQPHPPDNPGGDHHNYRSNVDTSRPFRSVKEAVAIFGDRILLPEVHSPKPFTFPKKETPFYSPSPTADDDKDKDSIHPHSNYSSPRGSTYSSHEKLTDTVKKLEAELQDTKSELKQLKERESETEVALASLNAELHKNMSKLALAEAAAAKKAAGLVDAIREEEKKRDAYLKMESSGSSSRNLAQILSIGEREVGVFDGKKREMKAVKKKPIIPLVGELFWRKKGTASAAGALHNPLYASPHLQWN